MTTLVGDGDNNSLNGTSGNDSLDGGPGNDTLYGGRGNDTIDGGLGIDTVLFSLPTPVTIIDQTVIFQSGITQTISTSLVSNVEAIWIGGGLGNDTFSGDTGSDSFNGGGGNDSLTGGAGNDTIDCGSGNNTISGGDGIDLLLLSPYDGDLLVNMLTGTVSFFGNSIISGVENVFGTFSGNDTLIGDNADNSLNGGSGGGHYSLSGGGGSDTLLGGGRNDTLLGGDGDDSIRSTYGNLFNSTLDGSSLSGDAGDDTLAGGGGNDTIDGGLGTDTVTFTRSRWNYAISWNGSSFTIQDRHTSYPWQGNDQVTGVENFQFSDHTFSADTLKDHTPPQLISTSPADDSTAPFSTTQIVIHFSEPVRAGIGKIAFQDLFGTNKIDLSNVSISGDTLTIDTGGFFPGSGYTITLPVGIVQDVAGNAFDGGSFSFVADGTAPSGLIFTPFVRPPTSIAADDVPLDMHSFQPAQIADGTITFASATQVNILGANGLTYELFGFFPENPASYSDIEGGLATLSGIAVFDNGSGAHHLLYIVSDLDVDSPTAQELRTASPEVFAHDTLGLWYAGSISGSTASDNLFGLDGYDTLEGRDGHDTLSGGAGNDVIVGGAGADSMTGGIGLDAFSFAAFADMAGDTVADFEPGDKLDFSGIANRHFIGTGAFTGVAGQLRYQPGAGTTILEADINGDGNADAALTLSGAFALGEVEAGPGKLVIINDTTAPLLVSTFPADNASGVLLDDAVSFEFNENIQAGAGAIEIHRTQNGSLFQSIDVQTAFIDARTLTVRLAASSTFESSTSYYVTMAPGVVHDLGGNSFAGISAPSAFNFTTMSASMTLAGDAGNNTLTGLTDADSLSGLGGNDSLSGGEGNDTLNGGLGADTLAGNGGDDTYVLQNDEGVPNSILLQSTPGALIGAGQTYYFLPQPGQLLASVADNTHDGLIDSVFFSYFDGPNNHFWTFSFSTEQLGTNLVAGTYLDAQKVTAPGHPGLDVSGDGRGANQVFGTFTVADISVDYSGASPALLHMSVTFEQHGENPLAAPLYGAIIYDKNAPASPLPTDTVLENPGEGFDSVQTWSDATLPANVENLILNGTDAISGRGNASDNSILGNSGANTLDGAAGADTLAGGFGNDSYIVDSASDRLFESPGEGQDTIRASTSYTLAANVEKLLYTGTGNFSGAGTGAADQLIGGAGADTLDGGAGADTLIGLTGDDTYIVDNVLDSVAEPDGSYDSPSDWGNDTIKTSLNAYTLQANFENLIYTGSGSFAGSGNETFNRITGGTGNDTLAGLGSNDTLIADAGNDLLIGGAGADSLTGGAGDDTFKFGSLGDLVPFNAAEHISDFGAGHDLIDLSAIPGLIFVDHFSFPAVAGQFSDQIGSGDFTVILFDMDGDGSLERSIVLDNVLVNLAETTPGSHILTIAPINPTAGNDTLSGGEENNSVNGLSGDDQIYGNSGNDTLLGGNGSDSVDGGGGNDSLNGGTDSAGDTLLGGLGDDTLQDDSGPNGLDGGDGNDLVTGGANDDFVSGWNGNDTLSAGAGNDTLVGYYGNDVVSGGDGNDQINDGDGNDTLTGGLGDDIFNFGFSTQTPSSTDHITDFGIDADRINIGSGFTFIGGAAFSHVAQQVRFATAGPSTQLQIDTNGDGIADNTIELDNVAGQLIEVSPGSGTFVLLKTAGSNQNDILTGGSSAETLNGLAGNDSINGNGGNDTLIGGEGSDTLTGGNGNDSLDSGAGNDSLDGGADNDNLNAGSGDDALDGGDGADTLTGGAGADFFTFATVAAAGEHITDFRNGADVLLLTIGSLGAQYFATSPFTGGGAAGLRYEYSGLNTNIEIDSNGDGIADGLVVLDNVHPVFSALVSLNNVRLSLAPPVAQNDLFVVGVAGAFSGNVLLENGGGPDQDVQGTGLTVVAVNGDASKVGTKIDGIFTVNANGAFSYDPTGAGSGFTGETFTYTVSDGANTATATATIQVGSPSRLYGSNSADAITGSANDELIRGFDGNDTLNGSAGNDTLSGGAGSDSLNGGSGANTVSYADSRVPVQVNLFTGSVAEGTASDSLASIQSIAGSSYNDSITGDASGNMLFGDPSVGARLVTVSSDGQQADSATIIASAVSTSAFSPDGAKLLFSSFATNLVPNDTNATNDIFIKDMKTGAVTRVSTASNGTEANGSSTQAVFSPDGTKVAFISAASNLVAGDTNGANDVFVKNLVTGAVTRVSVAADGTQGNNASGSVFQIAFSPDGAKLAFTSRASNLVAGDTNNSLDLFVKDLSTGAVTRVSTKSDGAQVSSAVSTSGIAFSPDGTKLAFQSSSSQLVTGDTNAATDVFLKDLTTGAITRVSTTDTGSQASRGTVTTSTSGTPIAFSPDGKMLAFDTALNLAPAQDTAGQDIYVKNLDTGAVTLVTAHSESDYSYGPVGFGAGGTLVFSSYGPDLAAGDTNQSANSLFQNASDVFVASLQDGTIARLINVDGFQGNSDSTAAAVSPDGTQIAFTSRASNLVLGDANAVPDVFVTALPGVTLAGGNDTIAGGAGGDTLLGVSGDDSLNGGTENDRLDGGPGNDTLAGGSGQDVFVFSSLNDLSANSDHIVDFETEDSIDLSAIAGLHFVREAPFSGAAGEVRYTAAGSTTTILIDTNGDGLSDKRIVIDNGAFALTETSAGSHVLTTIQPVAIEAAGITVLTSLGDRFYLRDSLGAGPSLKFSGAEFTAGQFGGWTPLGAEKTGSTYQIAWKNGSADQYTVWNVDANGNYTGNAIATVPGSDTSLQAAEILFQQDLNNDGRIGLPPATAIESFGVTTLATTNNLFYLQDGAGVGPALRFQGANFVAGQFGAWTPIGAEKTSGGYEVAWKFGNADQYTLWNTDANGNYTTNASATVAGSDAALQSAETLFQQDLNGDSHIGAPPGAPIESFGATKLVTTGNLFFLQDSIGAGPALKFQGANFVAGQFGAWTPIGAEKTNGGYEIAWKFGSADQYTLWNTDANGNYVSNASATVSGADAGLKSAETLFQQDLNGDGQIGATVEGSGGPVTTAIESFGATKLGAAANLFYLQDSTGAGPVLKFQGANFVAGQFGAWTPIGAEKTGSGYEVAWKFGSADQYTVWNTDANGNYTTNAVGAVPGSDSTLRSAETLFQQDLNSDGVIGLSQLIIEAQGVTKLATSANLFYLQDSNGAGPTLKFQGADFTAGQFGAWTPLGAEKTVNGYEIAWKFGAANQYTLWNTDANGNYVSNVTGAVAGSDPALQAAETLFQQDINGDGHIGAGGGSGNGIFATSTGSSGGVTVTIGANSASIVSSDIPLVDAHPDGWLL